MSILNEIESKEHKIFVYFPYQVSTQKVFQNANSGVFMAVPSPRFLKELLLTHTLEREPYALFCKHHLTQIVTQIDNWPDYFDVYESKYAHMYLQFDSWKELFDIIMADENALGSLREKFAKTTAQTMQSHRNEMDQKWSQLFQLTGLIN